MKMDWELVLKTGIYEVVYSRNFDISFDIISLTYLAIILFVGGEYLSAVTIKKCGVYDWDFFFLQQISNILSLKVICLCWNLSSLFRAKKQCYLIGHGSCCIRALCQTGKRCSTTSLMQRNFLGGIFISAYSIFGVSVHLSPSKSKRFLLLLFLPEPVQAGIIWNWVVLWAFSPKLWLLCKKGERTFSHLSASEIWPTQCMYFCVKLHL